jgi:hypothetical protein
MAEKSGTKKKHSAAKVIKAIVAVILCLCIIFGILLWAGAVQNFFYPVKIDGESYKYGELKCYYMMEYNYYYNQAQQMDSNYGEGTGLSLFGFDYTKMPDEQVSNPSSGSGNYLSALLGTNKTEEETSSEGGNQVYWSDHLLDLAINEMAETKRYYKEAVKEGVKLTSEDEEDIQSSLDQIKSYAGNYSVSRYLSKLYGDGVNEKIFTQVLTEQKYAERFKTVKQQELQDAVPESKVMAEYNKDTTAYDVADLRMFYFDTSADSSSSSSDSTSTLTDEQKAQSKTEAEKFVSDVKAAGSTEEAFKKEILNSLEKGSDEYKTFSQDGASLLEKTSKSVVESNVSEDAANWVFEKSNPKDNSNKSSYVRKTGDIATYQNSKGISYILFIVKTPYADKTIPASVRHILRSTTEDESESSSSSSSVSVETASEAVLGEDSSASESATDEETTVNPKLQEKASSEAQSIYDEYESHVEEEGSAYDEDYFAELADKYSDDKGSVKSSSTTTSSSEETTAGGGLISDMKDDGTYVSTFEDWVFSKGAYAGTATDNGQRPVGDTGIIQTQFGYHVMYYVGGHKHPAWYETIQSKLSESDYSEWTENFEKKYSSDDIKRNSYLCSRIVNSSMRLIKRNLESQQSAS